MSDKFAERRYTVEDGEAFVYLPTGYTAASVKDLMEQLNLDFRIHHRRETANPKPQTESETDE